MKLELSTVIELESRDSMTWGELIGLSEEELIDLVAEEHGINDTEVEYLYPTLKLLREALLPDEPEVCDKICQNCKKENVLTVSGKVDDMCCVKYKNKNHNGPVPYDINLGGGDYLEFKMCLSCGQIQGEFPVDFEA